MKKNRFFKTYPLYVSRNGVFHKVKDIQLIELTPLGKRLLVLGGALLFAGVMLFIFLG